MIILLTWVGRRDPRALNTKTGQVEDGPILTLLHAWRAAMDHSVDDEAEDLPATVDRIYLFAHDERDTADHIERAALVAQEAQGYFPQAEVVVCPVELTRPNDDDEVYRAAKRVSGGIIARGQAPSVSLSDEDVKQPPRLTPDPAWQEREKEWLVLLSPGTPAMRHAWIALAQEGHLPARLIEVTPPEHRRPGEVAWRIFGASDLPRVRTTDQLAAEIRRLEEFTEALTRERDDLRATRRALDLRVRILEDSLADPTLGGSGDMDIPAGFNLATHLKKVEAYWVRRAYAQVGGKNAAQAARLVGDNEHTFRKRMGRIIADEEHPNPAG